MDRVDKLLRRRASLVLDCLVLWAIILLTSGIFSFSSQACSEPGPFILIAAIAWFCIAERHLLREGNDDQLWRSHAITVILPGVIYCGIALLFAARVIARQPQSRLILSEFFKWKDAFRADGAQKVFFYVAIGFLGITLTELVRNRARRPQQVSFALAVALLGFAIFAANWARVFQVACLPDSVLR